MLGAVVLPAGIFKKSDVILLSHKSPVFRRQIGDSGGKDILKKNMQGLSKSLSISPRGNLGKMMGAPFLTTSLLLDNQE
jgi:hypothetical protein